MENKWCEILGIEVPRLEAVRYHPEANTYSLLLVALLERGRPASLEDVAMRFEEVGISRTGPALASLSRCRPARPPIYRDGDDYALDPHDERADLWAFRLGLRPPKAQLRLVPSEPAPDPAPPAGPDQPLSVPEIEEAFCRGVPSSWSAQRTAVCVLDAMGRVMRPEEVVEFVAGLSKRSMLSPGSAKHWHRGSPVRVREDGRWELDPAHPAVASARKALRARLEQVRKWARQQPDPAMVQAYMASIRKQREIHGRRLARLRRVILHGYPAESPEALVLLDVGLRKIRTFLGDEIAAARERLANYEVVAAAGVRGLLRSLHFDPGSRRLAELGPPQKTLRIHKGGRGLKITLDLLVRGSCRISHPFGDEKVMRAYVRDENFSKLMRRLEADAKSLFALYQYGRLHGAIRLRLGFHDWRIRVPWVHTDETTLYDLMGQARERGLPLQVVAGSAPGWENPWSRASRAFVGQGRYPWNRWLDDESGNPIEIPDVQLARLDGRG